MARIYTRTGDSGKTGLIGGVRVPKHHARVAAYGEVDELNALIGAALSALPRGARWAPLRSSLGRVQAELFVVGAALASPRRPPSLPAQAARRLEGEIDRMDRDLKPLRRFILPGGAPLACWLHLARTCCRRAERAVSLLSSRERLAPGLQAYLNRLSDHLFTAARWANARARRPETPWRGLDGG